MPKPNVAPEAGLTKAELEQEVADLKFAVSRLSEIVSKVNYDYDTFTDALTRKVLERLRNEN